MGKWWEMIGKSWENGGKMVNHGKIMGKWWENPGRIVGKKSPGISDHFGQDDFAGNLAMRVKKIKADNGLRNQVLPFRRRLSSWMQLGNGKLHLLVGKKIFRK